MLPVCPYGEPMSRTDVIILGGGLVGLTLAAALDSSGLSSAVIDPVDPSSWNDSTFDGRTSAVSSSSRRMFDAIGLAPFLLEPGCPIRTIRVADGLKPGTLAFEPPEGDDEPLGWMHENRHLRQALRARAEAAKHVTLHWTSKATHVDRGEHGVTVTLDSGETLTAPLLVAAEGRNSATRDAAGIRVARWQYAHAAIVSTLAHDRPHDGVAWEIFYPGGPFALLPMNDLDAKQSGGRHRSAIVWSVPRDDAPGWLSLSDADFAAEAQAAMGGFLGAIELLTPRSSYPLGFHHAARITAERFELVVNVLSMCDKLRLRVRVQVPADDATVPTMFDLYPGTEAMEREVYDMFGVTFTDHPDLSRILMPEDWIGHPLRKDYAVGRIPVQFKGTR